MRRSRLPINSRAVTSIGTIHFRSRHITKHFQSQKRGFRRENSLWLCNAVARSESQRSQFAIVRERSIQAHQILQRNFRSTERKRQTVERFGFRQAYVGFAQKFIKRGMRKVRREFNCRHIAAARERVACADRSENSRSKFSGLYSPKLRGASARIDNG